MPIYLKYNTASQEVPLGYFVDSTDGNTEETALTINNTDIKLWKTGSTTLANKNSGGGTHISNGVYYAVLDATDTNTIGPMVIFVHVSGALPVRVETVVLAAQVYDSLIAGTDLLDVNTSQLGGTTQTGNDVGADVDAILADTGTDGVVVAAASKTGYSLTATTGLGNQTANITGNLSGSVGSVTGAVGSVTGAVGSVTGNVGGNVTGSVGSISGVTFPTNFADLAITVTTGQVTVGTNNDKTGYSISGTKTTLDALNDVSTSQVNAEVVDALATDTYAEPGQEAPAATTTLANKINYLYKAFRNKITQSSTEYKLYADDTTTVDQKATVSDDGSTFTRGEIGTGP